MFEEIQSRGKGNQVTRQGCGGGKKDGKEECARKAEKTMVKGRRKKRSWNKVWKNYEGGENRPLNDGENNAEGKRKTEPLEREKNMSVEEKIEKENVEEEIRISREVNNRGKKNMMNRRMEKR